LYSMKSTGNIVINDNYGVSGTNAVYDVIFNDSGPGSTIRCYSCNLATTNEVSGVTYTGAYFISFKHDNVATSTKIWGKYSIPDQDNDIPQDETINRFNYATSTWPDSIARVNYYGTGTKDPNLNFNFGSGLVATSSTYRIACYGTSTATTSLWNVYRNETLIGTTTSGTAFNDATNSLSFQIDATNSVPYDTYTFVAFKNSNNQNTQKYLTMMQGGDTFTVDSGKTLEIKGGQSTSTDKTIVNYNPGSGFWSFYNQTGNELTFQEAEMSFVQFATGTVTVLNTVLNNETVTSTAILNADWYLGAHAVMVDSTSTPAALATTTISENSTTSQATVWIWSGGVGGGWATSATSQISHTDSNGKIPQPGTDEAIRIREYKKESATTTYYKYNLQITAAGFSNYNYWADFGNQYITSVSSTESTSTVDKSISENWRRYDIDVNNQEPTINAPPQWGTWYAGLNSYLVFGLDSLTVNFDTLDAGNSFTDTASTTLYVTTTAPNGYIVHAYTAANDGKLTSTSTTSTIARWDASNATPTTWGAGNYGFGYTTDDTNLSGGDPNRFATSTKYAGFTSSTEEVADRPGGSWSGATNVITYKVSVSFIQKPATYQTTITYICTANY